MLPNQISFLSGEGEIRLHLSIASAHSDSGWPRGLRRQKLLRHRSGLLTSHTTQTIVSLLLLFTSFIAERGRFELPIPCGTPLFESGTINHSDTSPFKFFLKKIPAEFFDDLCLFQSLETFPLIFLNRQNMLYFSPILPSMNNKIKSILSIVLFATYPTLSKFALEHNSPAVVAFLTEILTGVILLFSFGVFPELKKIRRLHGHKAFYIFISMGILAGVIGPLSMLMGYTHSSVLNGVLLISLQTPLVVILASIFLHEKIHLNHVLGIIVSVTGLVAYTTNLFTTLPYFTRYDLYFLLAAVAFACSNILYKKKISHVSHELVLIVRNLIGGLTIFAGMIFFSGEGQIQVSFDRQSLLFIGLIVLVPIIMAQSLWYSSLEKIKAREAAFFDTLYPLFAAGIAFAILGENITLPQFFSGTIMMTGILISQFHWHFSRASWQDFRLQHFKQH